MTEIRSYRRVFDLERRIYRIDRVRLNPGGIPVRGVVYFLVILAAVVVAGRLPLLAIVATALPWYLVDLALPLVSAALLVMIRVEGRPFHLAAHALVRFWTGPRQLAGIRPCAAPGELWRAQEIVLLPDGSDCRLRRMRYTGPGAVRVAVEHELAGREVEPSPRLSAWGRRSTLTLSEPPNRAALNRAQVVALAPGVRLLVRQTRREREVR
jgi:hypothetical protein